MKSKRKNRNWMDIEIDLEKAYDQVRWELIDASLHAAGVLDFLRNVIMSAIMSSSMKILWNGFQT